MTPTFRQEYMVGPQERAVQYYVHPLDHLALGSVLHKKLMAAATADPPVYIRSLCLEAKDKTSGPLRIAIGAWTDVPELLDATEGIRPQSLALTTA